MRFYSCDIKSRRDVSKLTPEINAHFQLDQLEVSSRKEKGTHGLESHLEYQFEFGSCEAR